MGKRIIRRQIRWDATALNNFIAILDYIKEESPINAKRVKTRIINIIRNIPQNPDMFKADAWKHNNDGTYRMFTKDSIRISYKIEPNAIFIARVSHTSQEPFNY